MNRHLVFLVVIGLVCNSSLGAPNCVTVFSVVTPCVDYVIDKASVPGPNCCNGVVEVKNMGKTHPDRQAICECLKNGAKTLPGLDLGRVVALPKQCGVDYNIPLDPKIDCSTIP